MENHCFLSQLQSQLHIMNADVSWVVDHLQVILSFPTPLPIVDPFGRFHSDQHHLVHALYVHTVGRCVCLVAMTVGASWPEELFWHSMWWTKKADGFLHLILLKQNIELRIFQLPSCCYISHCSNKVNQGRSLWSHLSIQQSGLVGFSLCWFVHILQK